MPKHLESLQTEVDTAYLYDKVAEHEDDPALATIFRGLAEIERGHAQSFLNGNEGLQMPGPSWRARTLNLVGKTLGYDYLIGTLMESEKSIANAVIKGKVDANMVLRGTEDNHVKILQSLIHAKSRISGEALSRLEGKHRTVGGNALRAAVMGDRKSVV